MTENIKFSKTLVFAVMVYHFFILFSRFSGSIVLSLSIIFSIFLLFFKVVIILGSINNYLPIAIKS